MAANIEVINTTLSRIFSNTRDDDMAIYANTSNQMIHIGCGSAGDTLSTVMVTNSNVTINNNLTSSNIQTNGITRIDYTGNMLNILNFVGIVLPFAGSTAPTGWLFCFGQPVSRTTFSVLFSVIGTTYGTGDGSTTFNLPDMRGRVVAGKDDMGGVTASRITSGISGINGTVLGAAGGSERMHAHNHYIDTKKINYNKPPGTNMAFANMVHEDGMYAPIDGSGVFADRSTATAGTGNAQNMQPTIIMNYIIRF